MALTTRRLECTPPAKDQQLSQVYTSTTRLLFMHYATVTSHDPPCKLCSQFNLPAVVGDQHGRVILVGCPTKKTGCDVCNKVEDPTFVPRAVSSPD